MPVFRSVWFYPNEEAIRVGLLLGALQRLQFFQGDIGQRHAV